MIAEFINHRDARWRNFLKGTKHDFYHLPEYAELTAANEDATPMAFYAEKGEGAFLVPLLIRRIPEVLNSPSDWYDCASPYGYAGIIISPLQEELHWFLDAFCRSARARGIVTAFLRLHPFFALEPSVLSRFGQLKLHGQTVHINLSETKERIWEQMSANHKRHIKRLNRLGFYACLDDWSRFQGFIALYRSTMQRVKADETYFFSEKYFEDLLAKLDSRVHLVCVLTGKDELAAAGLFMVTNGIVEYHLGGTAEQYLSLSPSKLLQDFTWRWAQEQSCSTLHLGGGVGGAEDSLFQFKAGFSPARSQFYTYRIVVDELKNATLCQAAKSVPEVSGLESTDFFPRYRNLGK